ncbi:hypothetical protein GGI25_002814 [Coemansia spiralis]|uniref:Uncharacterized protein n=2 Tax=Coemansia TaxID=4863 RepID=A0A9W8KYN5_9FUNG|nr:heat shock protein 90 [Coemansia spiralis]KAJ1989045.1 hypothetical protein EDC05_004909 [Coemansia umbellata]KAJ2622339.1 hypothetical protein GGI26_003350 [Coemansia sp. RSA 1358]KAJ2677862.1 hypothetical protein GGI25_002814 [Coemansia spiralis]
MRQLSLYTIRVRALAAASASVSSPTAAAARPIALCSRLGSSVAFAATAAVAGRTGIHRLLSSTERVRCYSTKSSRPDNESDAAVGSPEKHEFKAETKKLLHIVAHSLYSQREVFVRELISNASDALEKLRHLQTINSDVSSDTQLAIDITTDADKKTIVFSDSGIGMTEEELKENLGTIARSGSKAFIEKMQDSEGTKDTANTIVGQFGVGFYSAFMIGDKITVFTRSATPGSQGYCWESDGLGSYTLAKADNLPVGTKIVIHVKDDAKEFLEENKLNDIIKKYSNFVGFPISVNGKRANTIEALWTKDKNSITQEEHENFYRFVSNSWDDPMYHLVYKADGPMSIRSILYVPTRNPESAGFERVKPGVNLYSRKVLIMPNATGLLSEWLRFVQGVVDSEDLPLNLSRELLQNGPVIKRLQSIVTSRIIKWLQEESRNDAEKYAKFFKTYGVFIKEGVCQDLSNQEQISKLLRFETSNKDEGELISLDDYVERMPSDQNNIYYLCTPNRKFAIDSPYYEPFKKHGTEVLFLHHPLDEFVMGRLAEFNGKRLVSADSEDANKELKKWNEEELAKDSTAGESAAALTKEESYDLTSWMLPIFGSGVKEVKVADRYMTYPMILTDFDSPAVRNMMKMMAQGSDQPVPMRPCVVEVNPRDPVIKRLNSLRTKNEELARKISMQLYYNALIAAGIMDDPRSMLKHLNEIIAIATENL